MADSSQGEFAELQEMVRKLCRERDWGQFHNLKDLAISLNLEASEVLERFQWLSSREMEELSESQQKQVAEELADVLYWVLLMAAKMDIDLPDTFRQKMHHNALKYPIDKAKNNHKKYTELGS